MITYSYAEVAAQLNPGKSEWWLREGVRTGRFPCLATWPRRFTEDHVKQIAAVLEKQAKPQTAPQPADVAVLGATSRSAKRHRNRAS